MNQQNSSSLDQVISDNQNLIYSITKKYDYRLRDDLFQAGAKGMIDAFNNYDQNRSTKFSTYAYPYVAGEIKKFAREDRNIRVSREIIYLCSKIERARDLLWQKTRREPTTKELSLFLEIDEEKIIEALEINSYVKSIDEPINDDGKELTLQDVVSESRAYDLIDLISLRDELSKLSSQEKILLEKRYMEGMTQCETATILGVSQVEVSRMEKRLILSLRTKLKQ